MAKRLCTNDVSGTSKKIERLSSQLKSQKEEIEK